MTGGGRAGPTSMSSAALADLLAAQLTEALCFIDAMQIWWLYRLALMLVGISCV